MADETVMAGGSTEPIPVRLKTLKREEFTINVDDAALVSDLKKKIEQEKASLFQFDNSTYLQLVCAGKVLKDEDAVKNVYDPKNKAAFMVAIAKKSQTVSTPAAGAAANSKPATDTVSKNEDSAKKSATASSATTASSAAGAPSTGASTTPTTGGETAPASVANPHQQALEQNDALIKNIVEMGYPRAQVEQALILSQFNGDRAVQLLCDGMPFGAMSGGGAGGAEGADMDFDPNDPGAAALMAAAAAAIGGNADDDDDDDDDEGGEAGGAAGGGGGGLGFLRQLPQFEQMRQLIQQNPAMLPQLIQQIGATNPELLQMIQGNQEEFIQLLNTAQPPGGAAAAAGGLGAQLGAAAAAGGIGGGQQRRDNRIVINLTQADRDAIDRLKNMGFEEALVVQAYFACDKDENAAANFLLSQLQDD